MGRVNDGEVGRGRLGTGSGEVGEARPGPQEAAFRAPGEGQQSFVIFKVVVKDVCDIKFIIVIIKFSHNVVQPSPQTVSRNFLIFSNRNSVPMNNDSSFPASAPPPRHPSTFCLHECDCSRDLR